VQKGESRGGSPNYVGNIKMDKPQPLPVVAG